METEERTFPLTKLNSEIAIFVKATESVPRNKEPPSNTDGLEKQGFTLSKVLKKIVIAFGKNGENRQHCLLARNSQKNTDDSESNHPELDCCSL